MVDIVGVIFLKGTYSTHTHHTPIIIIEGTRRGAHRLPHLTTPTPAITPCKSSCKLPSHTK